ncbi:MAG: hypothetical protein IVW51_18000 [Thermaceae bacterium]|nr:hypothetical protein [Thermaceae bacterium]
MNELAVRTELDALTIASQMNQLKAFGEILLKSGLLPQSIKTPEAATVIILKGRELGIPPMEALNSINVIQGKPAVSPQLMLALVYRSGQGSIQILERTDSRSVVRAHRKGLSPQDFSFTLEDAKRLGLAEKDNYRKQPAVMLQWRNVAAAARAVFPDVVSGLYTPDEMGAEVEVGDDEGMTMVSPQQPREAEGGGEIEPNLLRPAPPNDYATPAQLTAISIALKEAGFGTSDKTQGREFLAFLVGLEELKSAKHLTTDQADLILESIGNSDLGTFRADKERLEALVNEWQAFRAAKEAPVEPVA